jgi:hypothetical protein
MTKLRISIPRWGMNINRNKAIDTAQLRQELHGRIAIGRNNSGIYYHVQALKGLWREATFFY